MGETRYQERNMALSAASMKDDIISALNGISDSADNACKKFGDAILANISRDAIITYTNSDGTFTCRASGFGTLTPSPTFDDMLIKLATLIKQMTISSPSPNFNPGGVLTVKMNSETSQNSAMQTFCEQVITSIIATFPNGMVII